MGQRYLIVIDDIWHIETWDNLKMFFTHDNRGSRILLTSRLTEVAKHASSDGLVHQLGCLNKERSWELLCQKVFCGNKCPEWSIKPGMQIVENCQGLPLALVIIAGVLAKESWSETFWVEIADRTSSYIVGDGCLETIGLSYNHLPLHLRECFLYLGGFPEDYKFQVRSLIWLWVAEGFIQQAGDTSLEDIAEDYLMDLIDRNLVIVADRSKSNGGVKSCIVHDLVRELCRRKAKEERFILQTERLNSSSQFSDVITPSHKLLVRMFINKDTYDPDFAHPSTRNLRSILCFSSFKSLSDDIEKYLRSFVLLRVLDLQKCGLNDLPNGMGLLIHLRYLAVRISSDRFPSSICNLWNLQTLIYITEEPWTIDLPENIFYLVNLRHFKSLKGNFTFCLSQIPMNLQTISCVVLNVMPYRFRRSFPHIKEFTCKAYLDEINEVNYLEHFTYLEKLNLTGLSNNSLKGEAKNHIAFPATLKTLTLANCFLPWSDMSIIQSLPNLQVLKLHYKAFAGSFWKTDEKEFQQLKFLRLEWLDIKQWEAYSTSFPCLRQLEILNCRDLEEIPLEIGDIPTLELIKIETCRYAVGESVRRIQEQQHDFGNYDLKIDILEDT